MTTTIPTPDEGFCIVDRPKAIYVYGRISMDWLRTITDLANKRGLNNLDVGVGESLDCWVFTDDEGSEAVRAAIAAENERKYGNDKLMCWRSGTDIGISSLTIAHVLGGTTMGRNNPDIPYDPDDFGRCLRLVRLMGWRDRLSEVAERYPVWAPFVEMWDELERLYDEELPSGRCPKLYELLQHQREGR